MAIVEKQVIRFTPDRRLQGRSVNLGNEGDNMVRRIMFALPDVDEHQAATLMYGGKYADMIQLTAMDGKWAADLTDEMVGAAGEVEGYIRIDGPDGEVWRSDPFRIETGDVPEIEVQIEKLYPTAVGQMLTAMEEHSGKMRESEELLDRLNEETQAAADTARTAAAAADGASLAAAQHRNAAETAAEGAASEAVQAATQADRATAQANQAAAQAQAAGQSAIEAGTQADRASDEADRAYRAAEGFKTPGAQAQQLEAGSQPTAAWERDGSGLPVLKLGIPKGDRGAQGIQGERGPQGVQGIQGKTGPQGERGAAFTYSDFTAAQLEALKGPKGDKGDPGEDAVIDTTLTQAGQAADAKATGGALSQLKDDLADKLPKSPANWEPWTADEQAAARERMGIPGNYELIEEITLEEDTVLIERNTEPDGTEYNLKGVICIVTIPNGNEDREIGWIYHINGNKMCYYFITIKSTYPIYCAFIAEINGGRIIGRNAIAKLTPYAGANFTNQPKSVTELGYIGAKSIKRIKIEEGRGNGYPADTKICIYGVRA